MVPILHLVKLVPSTSYEMMGRGLIFGILKRVVIIIWSLGTRQDFLNMHAITIFRHSIIPI